MKDISVNHRHKLIIQSLTGSQICLLCIMQIAGAVKAVLSRRMKTTITETREDAGDVEMGCVVGANRGVEWSGVGWIGGEGCSSDGWCRGLVLMRDEVKWS